MTNEYFAAPGINATAIKAGRESMRLMHHVMTSPGKPATPAMRWGTLIHAAVLEPDTVNDWAVFDGKDWRAKGAKEFNANNVDKTVVLAHEHAELLKTVASVHGNKHAADLVANTEHEVRLDWTTAKCGQCKARVDGVSKRILFDLKTTRGGMDGHTLANLSYRMGYHIQLGWYRHGAECCGYPVRNDLVYIIWLRQGDDLDCRVTRVSPNLLKKGEEEAIEIAHRYRVHEACGRFPGVSEVITDLEAPSWSEPSDIDMEGIEA